MKVKHGKFGAGTVLNIKDGIIELDFAGANKKFQFPQAFEKFLKTDDDDLLELIEKEKVLVKPKTILPLANNPISKEAKKKMPVGFAGHTPHTSWTNSSDSSHHLVGDRAQSLPIHSEEEMFEVVGYMARPGRVNSIEAEVPKDGRDKIFEEMFPNQTYRPIELGYTPSGMPNKMSPQFRVNFGDLSNCPEVLKSNMGKGNGACVGRINKSKFVLTIVQRYGFRFGDLQDAAAIRKNAVDRGFAEAFDRGYFR